MKKIVDFLPVFEPNFALAIYVRTGLKSERTLIFLSRIQFITGTAIIVDCNQFGRPNP